VLKVASPGRDVVQRSGKVWSMRVSLQCLLTTDNETNVKCSDDVGARDCEAQRGASGDVWLGECPSAPADDYQEHGSPILLSWWRKMWSKVRRRERSKHSPGECPRVLFHKSSHRVLESSSSDGAQCG